MENMEKLKLAVVAVQAGYLKKITGQITAMFGDRITVRAFQLGMLDKVRIEPDEVVFSAIPNLDKLVAVSFPDIRGFVRARRAVNLVNTGEIMGLASGRRVLVVGDHADVTQKVIRELEDIRPDLDYIPFHPGWDLDGPVDCAVTTGEVELVPDHIDRVINIGLRVISLETMAELNRAWSLGLGEQAVCRQYILSLVHVSSNWPVSRKNKYISNWIGTRRDDHPDQEFSDFIAQSPAMKAFIARAEPLCSGDHPVHIDGAIGVGKRRVAIAVHNVSRKDRGGFFRINCTSDGPELEKRLFGWEDRTGIFPGLLEAAGRGTVCIEEIENMPLDLQERLAGMLTDQARQRESSIQARVVTTAGMPLTAAFKAKRIRQALYHHLSLAVCTMPSLAERKQDFNLLIQKFLKQDLNRPELAIESGALDILRAHTWEGNVQEFYNVIFHLACLGEKTITADMLPFYIYKAPVRGSIDPAADPPANQDPDIQAIIREIEKAGFLEEYLQILEVYDKGRRENQSFGRAVVIERLARKGLSMTRQKLRRKQEHLNALGLIRVMKGRAGTTISRAGEAFLARIHREDT